MQSRPAASRSASALAVAWGGAALFALSLGFFLYCYAFRFGAAAPAQPALTPAVFDVLLFSVFALHHSLFARTSLKQRVREAAGPLERSVYTIVASVMFVVVCAWWQPLPGSIYHLEGPAAAAAYALQIAGLVVTARGSARLDVLDLAGVRPLLRARDGRAPAHVPLETRGLYGFVRHPLYFGWLLIVWPAPHLTWTRALFAAVSTAYLALAIPFEERSLVDAFGDEYRRYRERVRWRMLPGVY